MSSRTDSPAPVGEKYALLVIEDDERDWRLIERALQRAQTVQFDISRVSHLSNGITALRYRRYDAILLDLILQFDGPAHGLDTVVRVVKEAPGTPIVVLSSLADVETAVRAVEYGAAAYIEKPPNAHRLESVIRQAVERHVREDVNRRLNWESLSRFTEVQEVSSTAALVGAQLDNIEQGIHHIRAYLAEAAPNHAAEIDKILGWGQSLNSIREIRSVLNLTSASEHGPESVPGRRFRRRALSERALLRLRESSSGGSESIKTADDAKAFLLSLQTKPGEET
jgi:ActR/RegA family two-component response regulator